MIYKILFLIANKVIITRLKKYFRIKMMKPFDLALIFVYRFKISVCRFNILR